MVYRGLFLYICRSKQKTGPYYMKPLVIRH